MRFIQTGERTHDRSYIHFGDGYVEVSGEPVIEEAEMNQGSHQPLKLKWTEPVSFTAELDEQSKRGWIDFFHMILAEGFEGSEKAPAEKNEPDENELNAAVKDLLSGFAQK